MKKYKYITVDVVAGALSEHPGYCITNNKYGDVLGTIVYLSSWRQYVVEFEPCTVFSADCLLDIVDFLKNHAQGVRPPDDAR
jgi:hypothetical protein